MECNLAMVMYFAGNFEPVGWMKCDGRKLQIQHYAALFSLLGTTYGGDGMHDFALPIMPDLGGMHAMICVEGIYPSRP